MVSNSELIHVEKLVKLSRLTWKCGCYKFALCTL